MTGNEIPHRLPLREGSGAGVLARITTMVRGDGTAEAVAFLVDGVPATAEPHGRGLRLTCEVLPALPDDEAEARVLMARYLPYADHGAEVLCADASGRLLLVATLEPGDDVPAAVRDFCDAAVHWSRVRGGAQRPGARPAAPGPRQGGPQQDGVQQDGMQQDWARPPVLFFP